MHRNTLQLTVLVGLSADWKTQWHAKSKLFAVLHTPTALLQIMIVKATQFPGRVATFTRRKNWPFSGGKGHAIQEVEFVIKNRRHRFFFFFFFTCNASYCSVFLQRNPRNVCTECGWDFGYCSERAAVKSNRTCWLRIKLPECVFFFLFWTLPVTKESWCIGIINVINYSQYSPH